MKKIFNEEVISKWKRLASKGNTIIFRLEVLSACGPDPLDTRRRRWNKTQRARKAAWEAYINAADQLGFLDNDRISRLRSDRDSDFRGAMAECLAIWYFHVIIGQVLSKHSKREFQCSFRNSAINVEVKSPISDLVSTNQARFAGNDSQLIQNTLKLACKQLNKNEPNIVVFVAELKEPVTLQMFRNPFFAALYGQDVIKFEVGNPESVRNEFKPDGKWIKANPEFTRIGAVVCLQEKIIDKYERHVIVHEAYVFHNPFA